MVDAAIIMRLQTEGAPGLQLLETCETTAPDRRKPVTFRGCVARDHLPVRRREGGNPWRAHFIWNVASIRRAEDEAFIGCTNFWRYGR